MLIFYTQFLDDGKPHERELGISCGLQWTDFADEIWFCLRRTDSPSSGMLRAIERNQQLIKSGRMRVLKFLYFTQEGQPAGEWKPTQF